MELPYIVDVEASGFGRGSYPIEVGFARPDGTTSARLICPQPGWTHWNDEAQEVHGITREQLLSEGLPPVEVADWLNTELRGLTVFSDSWGFDSSWIALLFDEAERLQMFRVETLNKLLSEKQLVDWGKTKQQVLEELNLVRHRAADDAFMLQRTLRRVLKVKD
ncbi:hypothetical protein [Marinospirillum alkaliphilum]|uniref:Exonuclease n=1 Tax=Marinospirillum alkaliphilum DSM 21637 TaxID=1122209 RepID=A0A1K1VV81_9GAMM|nr:hypothetical protein [Marinospirillum alkaliphilum]SFX29046.1 hypothetical protein SAMN02745752_01088 [Marinospirillum alkaliphilum DSM 21637]